MTSRKFVSAWVLQGLWTGLLLAGSLDQGGFVQLSGLVWATYFAANVGEHFAKR